MTETSKLNPEPKFIRLNNGEDILTVVKEVTDDETGVGYLKFHKPLKVLYLQGSSPGILTVSMMQWVFNRISEDQIFTVYQESILTVGHASDDMIKYYHSCNKHFEEMKDKMNSSIQFEGEDDEEELFEDQTEVDEVEKVTRTVKPNNKRKLH